ncbi:MAG: tetratricopeptide repeat protein [Nitrospinae bacterium]|nr:tetratricopeptide repeat protein [Nitrospinota bacterium]
MATSSIGHVRHVLFHVLKNGPASVLDVGIGFGRWGFLCRELLDVFHERVTKDKWKTRIEGIEIYEPYIQPHQRYIYDQIHIGDAKDVINTLGRYDIIIIGDMLEHLTKDDGWALFHSAMERANMGLILNLPIGKEWLRETGSENKYEDHLSWWALDEFADLKPDTYLTKLENGMEHASMFISSSEYGYIILLGDGENAESQGQIQQAAERYLAAIKRVPTRPEAYITLANMLIGHGQTADAENILASMINACPNFTGGRLLLANLQRITGNADKALENARAVLEQAGDNQELKDQAGDLIGRIQG